MNAIAHLRPGCPGLSDDPAILPAAIQASPESLVIVAAGLIVYANPACCEMFEFRTASQLQGLRVEEIIPAHSLSAVPGPAPSDRNHEHRKHEHRSHDHRSHEPVNDEPELDPATHFVHTRRDGTRRHMEMARASFQLRDREFQVIHTRDVSPQSLTERQLREAQPLAAVGRLAGGLAHDFNNLLTGIMLYCDLLIGELEEGSRPHRHAREMRAAGEHGAAMVRQLLAVVRPSPGQSHLIALNDVVTSLEDLLSRLIGENIVLRTALAANLGAVRMDPAQAQQILLNLVLNARDAMPDGGRITLATRNSSGDLGASLEQQTPILPWVELTVTDTGCGMDAQTLDRAFEPFFTSKTSDRGHGLGLATARRLAEQEGGTLTAESEPGRGTRVSLRLPRAQSDSPSHTKVER